MTKPSADKPSGQPLGLPLNNQLGAWGRDDMMAIAAVRYCLGRMTYITSDCSEWLLQQWPNIKPNARTVIRRDIEEAFARDDEAREAGDSYKPLGWDCDRAVWQKVRELWAPNAALTGQQQRG